MFVTRFVKFLLCFIFLTSQAFAQNYSCELRPNGYAAAFASLNPNLSRNVQQEFLESLSPRAFKVNASYVTVESSRIEVSGGDREKSFHVRVNTNTYRLVYYINIDPFSGNGNVYIQPQRIQKRRSNTLFMHFNEVLIQTSVSALSDKFNKSQVVTKIC